MDTNQETLLKSMIDKGILAPDVEANAKAYFANKESVSSPTPTQTPETAPAPSPMVQTGPTLEAEKQLKKQQQFLQNMPTDPNSLMLSEANYKNPPPSIPKVTVPTQNPNQAGPLNGLYAQPVNPELDQAMLASGYGAQIEGGQNRLMAEAQREKDIAPIRSQAAGYQMTQMQMAQKNIQDEKKFLDELKPKYEKITDDFVNAKGPQSYSQWFSDRSVPAKIGLSLALAISGAAALTKRPQALGIMQSLIDSEISAQKADLEHKRQSGEETGSLLSKLSSAYGSVTSGAIASSGVANLWAANAAEAMAAKTADPIAKAKAQELSGQLLLKYNADSNAAARLAYGEKQQRMIMEFMSGNPSDETIQKILPALPQQIAERYVPGTSEKFLSTAENAKKVRELMSDFMPAIEAIKDVKDIRESMPVGGFLGTNRDAIAKARAAAGVARSLLFNKEISSEFTRANPIAVKDIERLIAKDPSQWSVSELSKLEETLKGLTKGLDNKIKPYGASLPSLEGNKARQKAGYKKGIPIK